MLVALAISYLLISSSSNITRLPLSMPIGCHYFVICVCQLLIPIDIKRKYRLLKVCYVPATSTTFLAFFSFFLAAAINSTKEANKAGGTCHLAVYIT
jgi:hypothetical protein